MSPTKKRKPTPAKPAPAPAEATDNPAEALLDDPVTADGATQPLTDKQESQPAPEQQPSEANPEPMRPVKTDSGIVINFDPSTFDPDNIRVPVGDNTVDSIKRPWMEQYLGHYEWSWVSEATAAKKIAKGTHGMVDAMDPRWKLVPRTEFNHAGGRFIARYGTGINVLIFTSLARREAHNEAIRQEFIGKERSFEKDVEGGELSIQDVPDEQFETLGRPSASGEGNWIPCNEGDEGATAFSDNGRAVFYRNPTRNFSAVDLRERQVPTASGASGQG